MLIPKPVALSRMGRRHDIPKDICAGRIMGISLWSNFYATEGAAGA
jgi:hypothetical protein